MQVWGMWGSKWKSDRVGSAFWGAPSGCSLELARRAEVFGHHTDEP